LVSNTTNLTPLNATLKYISGYLVEISLSIDNIFVIAVIFNSFKIPQLYQHRVLYWGIIGAIVFRAVMILSGVAIFHLFNWTNYIFGGFLIYTAYEMLTTDSEKEFNPKESVVFKIVRKFISVSPNIEGEKFFVKKKHLKVATPLFITLIMIELTDILFAFDSVPAIIAITSDPFLVFTSNIFAILGLRSLYFFLVNILEKFHALEYSLAAILIFIGIKLLLHHTIQINEFLSLGFIIFSLGAGIIYSIKKPKE
jgi:tellurite resistance protein TerC